MTESDYLNYRKSEKSLATEIERWAKILSDITFPKHNSEWDRRSRLDLAMFRMFELTSDDCVRIFFKGTGYGDSQYYPFKIPIKEFTLRDEEIKEKGNYIPVGTREICLFLHSCLDKIGGFRL